MDNTDTLYDLCETISNEIEEANAKIRKAGGKLTAGDVDYIDKLTHTLKSLKTTVAMMEADEGEYSNADGNGAYTGNMGGSYARGGNRGGNRGGSYARDGRGRGSNAKRDSMGRYSRRGGSYRDGGYSRDGGGVREMLEDAMEEAQTEREREAIRRAMMEL